MFLKLKCIAICLVLILTFNLAACLFVPETTANKSNDCQLVTKKWSLEFKKTDISGRVDGGNPSCYWRSCCRFVGGLR